MEYKRIKDSYEERKVRAADGTDEQTIKVPKFAMQKKANGTAVLAANAGVTRPWNSAKDKSMSIARMYGPG